MVDNETSLDYESLEELGRNADLRIYRLNGFVSRYRCYYRYIGGVDSKKSAQGEGGGTYIRLNSIGSGASTSTGREIV